METAIEARQPDITTLGKVFYESGMFPDVKSQAQAAVKIAAGAELGFAPVYSMQKVYLIKGRVAIAAEAMGALIKKSSIFNYKVQKLDDTECTLVFSELTDERKWNEVYTSTFTMADAKRADLVLPGSGWMKYPRAMLMSKALSQGARIVCPHIISGAYTPEDFGYAVNPETERLEEQPRATVVTEGQISECMKNGDPIIAPAPEPRPETITPEQFKKIKELTENFNIGAIVKDLGITAKSSKELTKEEADRIIAHCNGSK